ncbi:DEAD-box ATP-dependent RNA helicase CshA [compost metagenome]
MTNMTFAGLGIGEQLVAKLGDYGIVEPSPVQAECIPAALTGQDILAQSQTGTGKTLAYLLPLLQNIQSGQKNLQGLILAPTQELAMQIHREAEKYGESLGIHVQALIGGAAIKRQLERLKSHPQLVVGTPGRIREVLALKKLKLHTVKTIVVDEVDQMFQLGGTADVEFILRGTLRDRQLMFLSATINSDIRNLANREMKDPLEVGIEPEQRTSKSLEHLYFISDERDKIDTLRRIIRHFEPARTIVFINNTADIAEVEAKMNYVGLNAGALYGDADKTVRSVVLRRFREGKIRVLVASDVAARGLDIEDLSLVVNLDPPIDSEHYVHRVGRTGRMGREGLAVSIIAPKEQFIIRKFSKELGIEILPRSLYGGRIVEGREENAGAGRERRSTAQRGLGGQAAEARYNNGQADRKSGFNGDKDARVNGVANGKSSPRKPAVPTAAKKKDRNMDRKNKGAPKWLKDKQNKD